MPSFTTNENYNQDILLCRMCDCGPAVYRGLCSTCLDDETEEPSSGPHLKPLRRPSSSED